MSENDGKMSRRTFILAGGALVSVAALGGAAYAAMWAPEAEQPTTRMGVGMSKVLVVYGTGTGCTAGIADRIGKAVAAKGASVEVHPAKSAPDPAGYDAVLVGSGIRAGNWHAPVKDWVAKNAGTLKDKPVAFFTACLTMAQDPSKSDEVRAYTDLLIAETGVKPVDIGLFAGWNEPKHFSFGERTIMKIMKAPQGDFRDWAAIDSWSEKVAGQLPA